MSPAKQKSPKNIFLFSEHEQKTKNIWNSIRVYTPRIQTRIRTLVQVGGCLGTKNTYRTGASNWLDFCDRYGRPPVLEQAPISADHAQILALIAENSLRGLAATTIRSYYYGMRSFLIERGVPEDFFSAPIFLRALHGVKMLKNLPIRDERPGFPLKIIRKFCTFFEDSFFQPGTTEYAVTTAVIIGIIGMFRISEVSSSRTYPERTLRLANVEIVADLGQALPLQNIVHLEEGEFAKIEFLKITLVCKNRAQACGYIPTLPRFPAICPARRIRKDLAARKSQKSDDLLFRKRDGRALQPQDLVTWMNFMASRLGNNTLFAGHSMRIGGLNMLATTTLLFADEVDFLGRWATSKARAIYLRADIRRLVKCVRAAVNTVGFYF